VSDAANAAEPGAAPQISRQIAALPEDWHGAGTVSAKVLDALQRHAPGRGEIARSVETGTGRTTLLLSHMSRSHTVFTKDDAGDGDSLARVRSSPLLNSDNVTFVVGPTQRTLLDHTFEDPVELVYLDGPHAYPFPDLEYWALYPHLSAGGLLVIDDVQIPTIANLFAFLAADRMWSLVDVVQDTAFFRRTTAPALDPFGEGWWQQGFNHRFVRRHLPPLQRVVATAKDAVPERLRASLQARLGRP
jgi:predicted O-methyltransferase YrrM